MYDVKNNFKVKYGFDLNVTLNKYFVVHADRGNVLKLAIQGLIEKGNIKKLMLKKNRKVQEVGSADRVPPYLTKGLARSSYYYLFSIDFLFFALNFLNYCIPKCSVL